jgi:prepilin-type N-terminal cleavage/methylation domain-containing protein
MLHKLQQRKDAGFTIIEVMIVLAIAGLIMLIVFLAVPALQRNSHNTTRKNDIGRVGSAVNDWVSNNNGTVFTAGTGNANLSTVKNDAGALGQYTLTEGTNVKVATGTQSALSGSGSVDNVIVVTGAQCGSNGATTAGTSRQMSIQYMLESSDGNGIPACQNI